MSLVVLIPLSITLGLIGLAAFLWALRDGQFEDPDGAAWRVIPTQPPVDKRGDPHDKLAPDTQNSDSGRGL
ncbi:MAG: cytochrome oxidase maturation protein, cbb3-type [Rhodobacterales bacterium 32-67-9]|nr:MAG: cytochrome oxidase maturation protein, cbb3-type [Rhodobacterales bacterium 32-67-9]